MFLVIFFLSILNLTSSSAEDGKVSCTDFLAESLAFTADEARNFSQFIDYNSRFFKTKYGVLIEKACLKGTTKNYIEKNIFQSYQKGMSCFVDLNTTYTKKVLARIDSVLTNAESPQKIICSEVEIKSKGGDWQHAKSYASENSGRNDMEKNLIHPFVSISPEWAWQEKPFEFQSNIFHELFHNLGSVHTESVEYPYACQSCCFNPWLRDDIQVSVSEHEVSAKDAACRICKTEYNGQLDETYIKDHTDFRIHGMDEGEIFDLLMKYMKANTKGDFSVKELARFETLKKGELGKYLLNPTTKEDNELSQLANVITLYAKGDYIESARILSDIDSTKLALSEFRYLEFYQKLKKDLQLKSFSDNRIQIKRKPINGLNLFN